MTQSRCSWCDEALLPDDDRYTFANGPQAHRVCALRQVIGSVAHLEHRCACYVPGATCRDPDGISRRVAAEAAVRLWRVLARDELR